MTARRTAVGFEAESDDQSANMIIRPWFDGLVIGLVHPSFYLSPADEEELLRFLTDRRLARHAAKAAATIAADPDPWAGTLDAMRYPA